MRASLRLAAAAALVASLGSSSAQAENENRTTIQVSTVLASNKDRTFDARLAGLKTELRQLRFKSYTLVRQENRVVFGNGGQAGMDLPHGRYLHITTREHTPDHLRLHILLNEDNRPVVNTYVKLEMGNVLVIGGPRDEDGTLVIAIGSRPFREQDDEGGASRIPSSHSVPEPSAVPKAELPALAPAQPTPAVAASMKAAPGAAAPTPAEPAGVPGQGK